MQGWLSLERTESAATSRCELDVGEGFTSFSSSCSLLIVFLSCNAFFVFYGTPACQGQVVQALHSRTQKLGFMLRDYR